MGNIFIVGIDGLAVLELGLVGSEYYGPFASYDEACAFISTGEYECEADDCPVVLEIENPTKEVV
jgi:hypothetical protein